MLMQDLLLGRRRRRGVSRAESLVAPLAWGLSLVGQQSALKSGSSVTLLDVNDRFTSTTPSDKWLWNGVSAYAVGQTIRQDFDLSGNALGIPTERAATNQVRNPRAEGAVADTPGTMPTNWASFVATGIVRDIPAIGSNAGLSGVDVRFAGTAGSSSGFAAYFDTNTGIAALPGEIWTVSAVLSVVGGDTSNINALRLKLIEYDAGGVQVTSQSATSMIGTIGAPPKLISYTFAALNASTAFVRPAIEGTYTNGAAINITLRCAAPQCVKNGWPSSIILPPAGTPGASPRNVDKLKAVHALDLSAGFAMHWSGVFDGIDAAATQHLVSIANDAAPSLNQRAALSIGTTGAPTAFSTRDGTQVTISGSALTPGVKHKISAAVGAGDMRLVVNGVLAASSLTAQIPNAALTRLAMGSAGTSLGSTPLDGHTKALALTPLMTTAEMQAFQARMP